MPRGIITKGIMGFYYVKTENGVYECKPRGLFRKDSITPLPGDKVSISILMRKQKLAVLMKYCKNQPVVKTFCGKYQSNCNSFSIKSPLPDFMLVDKILVTARQKGIDAVILINKIDLDETDEYKN